MRKLKKYKPTKFMAKTSHYDKDAADYAVMFIESLCHTKGTWAGKPFELIDWQEQIIRDLFGVLKPNGYRQFNTAYIEIPKKQGKSELAAAVALLLLCGDGEERAEVYGCAADRNQAKIVFDVAVDMVRFCPALSKRVKILESQKKITYLPTNSSYQVLSADVANKHGFNTHGVIFDELHTQPNRKLFDVMLQGSGDARMQPLYFLITTAGNDTNSICYEVHQKAIDIAEGRKVDPTFYSVIYGAAENEDWTDPKVWKKANPSLGITVGIDKVRAACESARQNPGEENAFRQLRLNQWVKQSVRWMPMDKWDACAFPVSEDDLEGRICYGGLDLSSTTDITAFVLVFPPLDEEDKYYILPYFWIPEETLDLRVRRDHVPYDLWERQGTLMTTEGNVVHYGYIEKFIEQLGERFNIREIAFDRWGAVQMQKAIEMLSSVKDSIINAYEIKTGLSRAKLSHLMDAETWMDANKAVELGFADDVLHRAEIPEDVEPSAVSMLYSKAAVVNSLMDKIAAKCRTNPKKTEKPNPQGRSVDSLYERLNLLKH